MLGTQIYPRDGDFHAGLVVVFSPLGQYEAALKENLESIRLAHYDGISYRFLVYERLLLDRVEEAAATAKEAHAKGLDSDLAAVLYGIAFYQDDHAEMARQVASAAGKPGQEDLLLALEADTAAYFGRLGKAREFSRQAADSAQRAGEKETAASYYAVSALREALFGNADKSRKQATVAKGRLTGRDLDYGVALALAYAGDQNRAQVLADDLAKRYPEDTVMQFNDLPTLRAKLALSHLNPNRRLTFSRPLLRMNLVCRRSVFTTGPICTPPTCEEKLILRLTRAAKQQQSFRKSSTIAESRSTNPSAHLPTST